MILFEVPAPYDRPQQGDDGLVLSANSTLPRTLGILRYLTAESPVE